MMPQLRPTAHNVGGLDVGYIDDHVRDANASVPQPPLSGFESEVFGIRTNLANRLQIHLREVVTDAGLKRSGGSMENESAGLRQTQINCQACRAKAGISAEG